jgi:hypothetical protein
VKHIGGAAILVAALAISAPTRADSPMTPLRPLSGAASQWLEPPPAAKPPPESPEPTADTAAAAAPPEERPTRQAIARPDRDPPPSYRPAARTGTRGSYTTHQLNRQQLRALGVSAGASYYSSPYDPGFGPAPYSSHGD